MPEIPNVVGGEIISSDWGNDVRDRTIQRYANAAERTADHSSPTNGDLSYLNDTGKIYIFHSGAWRLTHELHGAQHAAGGSDPLGDHAFAHYSGQSDDLGSAISGYIAMNSITEDVLDSSIPSTFVNGANVNFVKPGSWTNYTLMAWGSVDFGVFMEGVTSSAEIRMNIGGTTGTTVANSGTNDPEGYRYAMSLSATLARTGLTTNNVVVIQYRVIADPVHKVASSVSYIAVRTS